MDERKEFFAVRPEDSYTIVSMAAIPNEFIKKPTPPFKFQRIHKKTNDTLQIPTNS